MFTLELSRYHLRGLLRRATRRTRQYTGGQGGRTGNPYAQQGGNPYAQPSGNPYAQQSTAPYPTQEQYGGGYGQPQGGNNDLEMQPVAGQGYGQTGAGYGQPAGRDPNAILNECRDIDQGITSAENTLGRLRNAQQQALSDTDVRAESRTNKEVERLSGDIMTLYGNLVARMKKIKSRPESGSASNAPQVGRVDRRLKAAMQQYQVVERDFRREMQAQMERSIRIVSPNATDEEVREAIENGNGSQIFAQAVLQSDRRGQAQSTLNAVNARHLAIQHIEQQMIQIAQMTQDLDAIVVEQEAAVVQIEQKGEQVTENVSKANNEISGAIVKARSRNRKKWWCLLIVILLLIAIAIIVTLVVVLNRRK
ncbi:MAG: eukaryotic translation initiation factor 4E [Watsoniomyces obsoletus]|nr:MAG: eukaryotic translation initiation factor 4E [Watsoniomyces obsoletus]